MASKLGISQTTNDTVGESRSSPSSSSPSRRNESTELRSSLPSSVAVQGQFLFSLTRTNSLFDSSLQSLQLTSITASSTLSTFVSSSPFSSRQSTSRSLAFSPSLTPQTPEPACATRCSAMLTDIAQDCKNPNSDGFCGPCSQNGLTDFRMCVLLLAHPFFLEAKADSIASFSAVALSAMPTISVPSRRPTSPKPSTVRRVISSFHSRLSWLTSILQT